MKRGCIFLALSVCCSLSLKSQPNWVAVKSTATVQVALPAEFGTPYVQSLNTGGWEDGLYISRDGLNLYCFYIPIDGLSWTINSGTNCSFSAYLRGPTYGMDLVTNPIGCSEWLQSDILISSRSNTLSAFPGWSLSNLSGAVFGQGAPQYVMLNSTTVDFFIYTDNTRPPYKTDLYYIRNSGINPPLSSGIIMPAPITTDSVEDNPHVERLSASDLVLFFDSPDYGAAPGGLDLWYSLSHDDGASWNAPVQVSTVNTTQNEHQPHLYKDALNQWWIYFTAPDASGKYAIYRAQQTVQGNWDSWSARQLVVGPGNSASIGEATLTQNGDLSFVLINDASGAGATSTDRFDCDPWFLPHIGTVTGLEEEKIPGMSLYPNPAQERVSIRLSNLEGAEATISLLNTLGETISTFKTNTTQTDLYKNHLSAGIYYVRTEVPGKPACIQKLVFAD